MGQHRLKIARQCVKAKVRRHVADAKAAIGGTIIVVRPAAALPASPAGPNGSMLREDLGMVDFRIEVHPGHQVAKGRRAYTGSTSRARR